MYIVNCTVYIYIYMDACKNVHRAAHVYIHAYKQFAYKWHNTMTYNYSIVFRYMYVSTILSINQLYCLQSAVCVCVCVLCVLTLCVYVCVCMCVCFVCVVCVLCVYVCVCKCLSVCLSVCITVQVYTYVYKIRCICVTYVGVMR